MTNKQLIKACEKGDLKLAFSAIEKGANVWNWGLYYVCNEGHLDLALLMIEKELTIGTWDYIGLIGEVIAISRFKELKIGTRD